MVTITQKGRPFQVFTPLPPDTLLLERFAGTESVSVPFSFQLDMLSEQQDVAATDLLREPLHITLQLPDGEERVIHGLVNRFTQLPRRHGLRAYRVEVVPWLWFLSLSRDCRIFQNLTVTEILEDVFSKLGYADFEIRVNRSYPKREYCVQYRETHLNFVSRLMEEEGLFYFFEHTKDKHTLVIVDDNGAVTQCEGGATIRAAPDERGEEAVVTTMTCEDAVHSATFTLKEYDYLQPSLSLQSSISGDGVGEVYDFLGNYASPDEGDRYALLQLEAEEARRRMVKGSSTARGFQSGRRFNLTDDDRDDANQEYVLLQVVHWGTTGDYLSGSSTAEYGNEFLAIPHAVPYRPARGTPKPSVGGTQTALVVGPAGEEVYVDSHGRVKVQFYWDRYGSRNENSSCWVRVAQPWAGKGYGTAHIPRIGNEVVVEFLDGDPDRPLIIGSVYNADQTPPFSLPGSGIQMGMKSRSSKGGGGFNEIAATDTKGKEMLNIHAQYDMVTTVQNDQTNTINNNRSTAVAVDHTESVGSNQSISVGADQATTVGANQKTEVGADRELTVGSNQKITVGSNQDASVGSNNALVVGGNDDQSIGSNQSISVGSNQTITIGSNGEISAGVNQKVAGGVDVVIEGGVNVKVTAGVMITLSAGGSTIEIGPAGITIQTGAMVMVQGSMIKLN